LAAAIRELNPAHPAWRFFTGEPRPLTLTAKSDKLAADFP
jgi:hypothetical protein